LELAAYTGIGQFGRAWQYVLERDPHAPGSVDRALLSRMARLCSETAGCLYRAYTPTELGDLSGVSGQLTRYAQAATCGCATLEQRVAAIARFTAALADGVDEEDLGGMLVGGTEEQVIARGSDWCVDVARVACALCQVVGVPARLVYLCNTGQAYWGHAIIEAHREGAWGAVDSSTSVVYRRADGTPATTWELMGNPALVEAHRGPGATYTRPDQFKAAAVANYFVWDRLCYDYTVSGLNGYYRSILEMSNRGWPGGLRWLHGEDRL
jgi:transglutaminase-like putative cysteine protease